LGFHALEALSDSLANPFSKNRKGINLGEGAAFFLLDSSPQSGGIELFGYGESCDAYNMTAPGTDGAGPAKAMKTALANAGIEPSQIGYVNLHGTSTLLNDKAEALAMKYVFSCLIPPSSSTQHPLARAIRAAPFFTTGFPVLGVLVPSGKITIQFPYFKDSSQALRISSKSCEFKM